MNRHQRRAKAAALRNRHAFAHAGGTIDVRIPEGDPELANAIVLVVSSPVGEATSFSLAAATQEEAVQHAESIADTLLKPQPEKEWELASRPSRVELVTALSRLDPGVCWVTYVAFDGPGNMRMRQERRARLVLS